MPGGEGMGKMRRVLIGLAVTALAVLSLAEPASAARGQVTHFRSQGVFAEGFWAIGDTGTYIRGGASKKEGSFVMVDQITTDPQTGTPPRRSRSQPQPHSPSTNRG